MAGVSRGRPAAFVDRDGTIIAERNYLADPDGVELLPGAAAALRRLHEAGYALVLVTNQSGLARGLFTLDAFLAVQQRIAALLRSDDVAFDGVYYCPHHPDFGPPCECRKPGLALFHRAAGELGLDLTASACIGDRLQDVEPAAAWHGRGLLVRTGYGAGQAPLAPPWVEVVADLAEAAERLAAG